MKIIKSKHTESEHRHLAESHTIVCPFCGQVDEISLDEGGGEHQTWVEDCSICCKPRVVHLDASPDSAHEASVWVERSS